MSDVESTEKGTTVIHIDRKEYKAPSDDLTGAQIRALVARRSGPIVTSG